MHLLRSDQPLRALTLFLYFAPTSEQFHGARFLAFESCFMVHRNNKVNPLLAFVRSIHCLLHENQLIFEFSQRDAQVRFDTFLLLAAGMKEKYGSSLKSLDNQDRLILLKYILMQYKLHSKESAGNTNALFAKRQAGFKKLLREKLPVIESRDDIKKLTPQITEAWLFFHDRQAISPFLNNTMQSVVTALSTPLKPPQPS